MKTIIQAISNLFLVLLFVGCASQPEVTQTLPLPTQTTIPLSVPTLDTDLAEVFSPTEKPSTPAKSIRIVKLPPLTLSEFNARYATSDFALSQDGAYLAVVSKDKFYGESSIWVWSASDFNQSLVGYQVYVDTFWSVAFSPDDNKLAVGGFGKIIIFDWKTWDSLEILELPKVWMSHLEFGSNDTLVSNGANDKVAVWDLSNNKVKYFVEGIAGFGSNAFSVSPDSGMLVTGAYDGIQLWNIETGQNLSFRKGPTGGIGIAPVSVFSATGKFLASTGCSEESTFEGCSSGKIFVWQSDSETPSVISGIQPGWIKALAFSPDGEMLASTDGNGKIRLLNIHSGKIVNAPSLDVPGKLPPIDPFMINNMNFLSNGKLLAISTTDGIQLLNVATMSWMPNLRFILSLGYPYLITMEGNDLNFRTEPSMKGEIIKKLHTGEWFAVIDGPIIADQYVWWKVRLEDDTEGWIVEKPGWFEFDV